jgi:hypothetical protein
VAPAPVASAASQAKLDAIRRQYGATDTMKLTAEAPSARVLGQQDSMRSERLLPTARPTAARRYQEMLMNEHKDEF